MTRKVVVVGAGKVGTALAVLLQKSGYRMVGVASRTLASAEAAANRLVPPSRASDVPSELTPEADVVILSTRDDVIQPVCEAISALGGFRADQVVLHVSGSLPSSVLSSAAGMGCRIGSMHPLQSFADVDVAIQRLGGAYFCLEGDKAALEVAKEMVEALGGQIMTIRTEDKPIYHAAAVIASNFFVSIIDLSLRFYEAIGIDREQGLEALLPLIEGSLNNIRELGPVKALTGPIARGDTGVVKRHLAAIERTIPEALAVYKALARINVEVGLRKGTLDGKAAQDILAVLEQ